MGLLIIIIIIIIITGPNENSQKAIISDIYLLKAIISAPNENSQKAIISGPNENSQKASISVYVLTANSQDEVYEGTTRPRPEKRQANTKTRRRDE